MSNIVRNKIPKGSAIKRSAIVLAVCIVAFISLFYHFSSNHEKILPKASKGVLNLTDWSFERDGKVSLDGEWEFYWNKLLTPDDFKNKPAINASYIKVPGYWNEGSSPNSKLTGDGYSTYRLIIHSNEDFKEIAIKVGAIFSSYRMWIGDKEVLHCGIVGSTPEDSKSGMEALIGSYEGENLGTKDIQIVIQASNFIGGKGGILNSIYIGTPKQIETLRENNLMKENYISAITVFMGLFYLLLFFIRKKEKYTLYLGILCILIYVRGLFLGELSIYSWFSGDNPEIFFKISFLVLSLSLITLVMYYDKMFPYEIQPLLKKILIIINGIFNVSALFFPYRIIYWLVYIFELFALIVFIILIAVTVKVVIKKVEGYMVIVLGVTIMFLSAINDTLFDLRILRGVLSITDGIFIYLLLQAVLLCIKYANTFKINELFYKAELDTLQAQIKPHFIFNVLNTIIYFTKKDANRAHSLLLDLADYLRNHFSFRNTSNLIDLEEEISHLKSYINLEKARFGEKLKVIFDIPSDISAKIPVFLIQPIVENALKHGILPKEDGGLVKISVVSEKRKIIIKIEDNGVGMSRERLEGLLDDNVDGYGVGVRNVNKRLINIFGKPLKVESIEGVGTNFTMEIPQ
ncbi:MAG: histidine kinase [Bacillota bacterium]|nr:histidine kinase [Bacillota bacterium]